MALCNDGHGSARRHRDLNGGGERFEFPRGSRPPGTPGGCVTELLLGLKTPLVEKGPVPRRATPAANGIGVAAPALAGMGELPVVFVPMEGGWQLGVQTEALSDGLVSIFVPGAPNPHSGSVFFFSTDTLRPAGIKLAAGLNCLRRCGAGASALGANWATGNMRG